MCILPNSMVTVGQVMFLQVRQIKKDLKILSKCEEVIGTVKHTKKMNDGDYKFALKVRDQYKDLLNKINKKKTGGYLIVEIVPKDQKNNKVIKPKTADKVDVWGAWVNR